MVEEMIWFSVYTLGMFVADVIAAFVWMYSEDVRKIDFTGVLFCALLGFIWPILLTVVVAFAIGKLSAIIAEKYYYSVYGGINRIKQWLRK